MELQWCAERGIPHSQLLSWSPDDRVKLMAWLAEDAERCSSCGTASWEWAADRQAYIPHVHVCRGCALREQSADMGRDVPGGTVVLLGGDAKKQALAEQRAAYLASRSKG